MSDEDYDRDHEPVGGTPSQPKPTEYQKALDRAKEKDESKTTHITTIPNAATIVDLIGQAPDLPLTKEIEHLQRQLEGMTKQRDTEVEKKRTAEEHRDKFKAELDEVRKNLEGTFELIPEKFLCLPEDDCPECLAASFALHRSVEELLNALSRPETTTEDISTIEAIKLLAESLFCESPTLPYVFQFALRMEEKLALNRHKGDREGWLKDEPAELFIRIQDEMKELADSIHAREHPEEVMLEAADVANMAMMTADSYKHREQNLDKELLHERTTPNPDTKPQQEDP